MQQTSFWKPTSTEFGGSLLKRKRKGRRPLSTKRPIHLVLKATNSNLLLRNRTQVQNTLTHFAERFGIKIYECAVHADHVHVALKIPTRERYVCWIRAVTSVLSQRIRGLQWKLRPYTRLALWGRQFLRLKAYLQKNQRDGDLILIVWRAAEEWRQRVLREFFGTRVPV